VGGGEAGVRGVGGGLFGVVGEEVGKDVSTRGDEAGVGGVVEAEVDFDGAFGAAGVVDDFGEVDDGRFGTLLAFHGAGSGCDAFERSIARGGGWGASVRGTTDEHR
jgi:hypothetical protein